MRAVETPTQYGRITSGAESLDARKAHPAEEKDFTRPADELTRQRRELPGTGVKKTKVFDVRKREETLGDLFDGLSESIVHHLMFSRGEEEGCPSLSSCPIILTAPLFI